MLEDYPTEKETGILVHARNHANIKRDKYVARALSPKMFANKNNV